MSRLVVGDLLITDLGNVAVLLTIDALGVTVGYYKDNQIKKQDITHTMASKSYRRFKAMVKDGDK